MQAVQGIGGFQKQEKGREAQEEARRLVPPQKQESKNGAPQKKEKKDTIGVERLGPNGLAASLAVRREFLFGDCHLAKVLGNEEKQGEL